jgi:hypothetical protein
MTTPYRDDREALEERLASLQAELTRVRETIKNLGDEQRAAESLEKEIAGLRTQLEDRARRTELENLSIAAPCNADWDAMKGDDRVRFCGSCQKNVYNLSALSRADAEHLIAKHEGPPPCIRLYKRTDGTVITNDCPVGRRRRRFRRIVAASIGGTFLAASAFWLTRRGGPCSMATQGEMAMPAGTTAMMGAPPPIPQPPPTAERPVTMGKVAVKPPPTPPEPSAAPSTEFATPPPNDATPKR